jgi:hypothetical protein
MDRYLGPGSFFSNFSFLGSHSHDPSFICLIALLLAGTRRYPCINADHAEGSIVDRCNPHLQPLSGNNPPTPKTAGHHTLDKTRTAAAKK